MRRPTDIRALDRASPEEFAAGVGWLFEDAPRFLARLARSRPFGSWERLFDEAERIALAMPEADQVELVDAHPRLGAPPVSVSAASFREQGYERGADPGREALAAELERLNEAYEARFGFRYCVFVAGRSRAELLPGLEAALSHDRADELRRALRDVVAIARDRHRRSMEEGLG